MRDKWEVQLFQGNLQLQAKGTVVFQIRLTEIQSLSKRREHVSTVNVLMYLGRVFRLPSHAD